MRVVLAFKASLTLLSVLLSRVSGGIWLKNFDCSESEPCFTDCYDYPVNSFWITDCLSGPVDVSCGM